MRLFLIVIGIITYSICQGQENDSIKANQSSIHKVMLLEVLQTSNYTYLRVKEYDSEKWLATPKIQAEINGTYYYEGGMEMRDFYSKEMDRTFESIFFLEKVGDSPEKAKKSAAPFSSHTSKSNMNAVKKDIKFEPAEGGVTIAKIFASKELYADKTVKIRGQIVKFNASIMGKNWIHIQDGTEYNGKFDLVATSDIKFKVGDIVTIEGKIALDKDFGNNYFYEVIMEETILK